MTHSPSRRRAHSSYDRFYRFVLAGGVTGAVVGLAYLAFVVGWLMDGRSPAGGASAIAGSFVLGGVLGAGAVAVQRAAHGPRALAPLVALALMAVVAACGWFVLSLWDAGEGLQLLLAVSLPLTALSVTLSAGVVAFARRTQWRGLSIVTGAVVGFALLVSFLVEL